MIKIYAEGKPKKGAKDYPIKELGYLLEEHDGKSFVLVGLMGNILREMED